ncbi:DUF4365 domain-containing protein [Streptosporangium sp. NPDC049304]|uniref:DUF4365 domain-containing protein n=1 Tax=Streptosporangium sp. NPDC049304 TaxID=3154830 RepID=UPI0034190059
MEHNNQQGSFGESVVAVLAAAGGYSHGKPVPDNGIDLYVARHDPDPEVDARIELQIKTTRVPDPTNIGDGVSVRLDFKRFRQLTGLRQVPAYLVAVVTPPQTAHYVAVTAECIRLKHCAYWVSLADSPVTAEMAGQKTVSVLVPSKNLLTVETIGQLLDLGIG